MVLRPYLGCDKKFNTESELPNNPPIGWISRSNGHLLRAQLLVREDDNIGDESVMTMTAASMNRSKRRSWSRELVIDSIKDRYQQGLALNPQRLQKDDARLLAAGRRYFGSWPKALKAAKVPPVRRMTMKRHHRGYWTRELLVSEIRHHAALGHPLYAHAMQQLDNALVSAATYHFGSWADALLQSGFDPDAIRANRRHSPDSVAEEIRGLLEKNEALDETMARTQYRTLYWAARKHFGSWNRAVATVRNAPTDAREPVSLS